MEAICCSEKEWTRIMVPALCAGLSKMGVWKNFPRDIAYGPEHYQGLGLTNPYLWQNLLHIRILLQEGGKDTIKGQLLQTTIEQLRMETGYDGQLTDIPEIILEIITPNTWIGSTISFMIDSEMEVKDTIKDFRKTK